jgi:hypothetical protein
VHEHVYVCVYQFHALLLFLYVFSLDALSWVLWPVNTFQQLSHVDDEGKMDKKTQKSLFNDSLNFEKVVYGSQVYLLNAQSNTFVAATNGYLTTTTDRREASLFVLQRQIADTNRVVEQLQADEEKLSQVAQQIQQKDGMYVYVNEWAI